MLRGGRALRPLSWHSLGGVLWGFLCEFPRAAGAGQLPRGPRWVTWLRSAQTNCSAPPKANSAITKGYAK